ncbi:unnamed protein product [Oncorhynchus mykiss]|uniref:Uncharacterized protein n=1 Tax=Oncorhynchus mykiss TaxID=8022 RepID=A0A060WEI5_ONCMY|nr:unnamed protein product [Oncorhynchus mykiss]
MCMWFGWKIKYLSLLHHVGAVVLDHVASHLQLWAGLRFTVPRLKDTHKTVQFELQIRSKNENNSHSEVVPYKLEVVVQANVILQGVSRPDKVFFPPLNWKVSKTPQEEQDIGPVIQHVYELVNKGPSGISHTVLQLSCPLSVQGQGLLYPLEMSTEGPLNCTTNHSINYLQLKVSSQLLACLWMYDKECNTFVKVEQVSNTSSLTVNIFTHTHTHTHTHTCTHAHMHTHTPFSGSHEAHL